MSRQFARRSRGSVATTVALTILPMFGFVSMGVDWGQVSAARFAARAVADETALAGASALSNRPTTTTAIAAATTVAQNRANQYAAEMEFNRLDVTVKTLTVGYYNSTTKAWSTTVPTGQAANAVHSVVKVDVDMTFAQLFGINKVTVTSQAKAGASVVPGRAPDLVIVQDVTPSMDNTDIANSKTANKALVNCIQTHAHPSTRGAFVKFANADKAVVTLKSYASAPNELYNAVAATSPTNAYDDSGVCLGSGGCTSHASGMYSAVDILNSASAPPDDVGQAIIFITDGAPYTGDDGCTAVAKSSGTGVTNYQKWLVGNSTNRCGKIAAQTTQTNCENAGGRWDSGKSPKCRTADNGAEGTTNAGVGKCTKTSYTTEARCEGNNGIWNRSSGSTANPSALTQWTDQAKALAAAGTHGPIDVYAVYYSNGANSTYKADALKFLSNHVVSGAGATLGVLDAPSGSALTAALEDLCEAYSVGSPGLIE